jgi:hypothetical protein
MSQAAIYEFTPQKYCPIVHHLLIQYDYFEFLKIQIGHTNP